MCCFYPLREKEVDHPRRRQAPEKCTETFLAAEMTTAAAAKKKEWAPKTAFMRKIKKKKKKEGERQWRRDRLSSSTDGPTHPFSQRNDQSPTTKKLKGSKVLSKNMWTEDNFFLKRMGGGVDGGRGRVRIVIYHTPPYLHQCSRLHCHIKRHAKGKLIFSTLPKRRAAFNKI